MMRTWFRLVAASVIATIGCGDNLQRLASDASVADLDVDAPISTPCWLDTYTPSGSVQLGTGTLAFEPMPDNVALEYGTQAGFDIPVNARITGLLPGNPRDTLDPSNPKTRFHGFFVDSGDAINPGRCGIRVGYMASGPSTYDLALGGAILFDTALKDVDLFGRQVRVVVEVIDSAGNYAMDEKVVTCDPPPGWPGCCI